jgi:hypothetical protein
VKPVVQLPLRGQQRREFLELVAVRQPLTVEEMNGFLERRVLGQIVDVVPDVEQLPELPIDVGDRRFRCDDVGEPLLRHLGQRIMAPQ